MLIGAIDGAKVGAEATRYAPALKLAQRVLADSTLQTREVVLISDFQRNGWVRDENLRLPEGTTFKAIPITDAQTREPRGRRRSCRSDRSSRARSA